MQMMMNEFDVPYNDAELSMMPKGVRLVDRQLAESGTEMKIGWFQGLSLALGVFGASQSANAANRSAAAQNEYNERKYAYDLENYGYSIEKTITERDVLIDAILLKAKNEKNAALIRDANAARNYNYQMKIRNRQQESANQVFLKSSKLYNLTRSMNDMREQHATENEMRKLKEIESEAAFSLQEEEISSFQQEQAIMARGQGGRSTAKLMQSKVAEHGRKQAMVNQALSGARKESYAALKTLKMDRLAADIRAFGDKALPPGDLPTPIKPFKTPITERQMPRELEEFDFGPAPVKGVAAVSNSSAIWANAAVTAVNQVGEFTDWNP